MKKKIRKKTKKKNLKKRRIKVKSKRNGHDKSIDLQKIISFKFQKLSKAYGNFTKKKTHQNMVRKWAYIDALRLKKIL